MTQHPTRSPRSGVKLPILVALAALLVTGGMLLPGLLQDGSGPAEDRGAAEVSREGGRPPLDKDDPLLAVVRRDADDPMALGDVDAPVVMVEYSDFQCPFCGKFARDTEPELIKRFVDKGVLRLEWRDFPYLGPESLTAAHAGRAAAAQGRFWEFQEAMYADQQPPNSGKVTEGHLVEVAEEVGLDPKQFRADLRSRAVAQAVQRDFKEGQSIGVTGTPAFLINGQPVMGAQPTDVFVEMIEQAAERAQ